MSDDRAADQDVPVSNEPPIRCVSCGKEICSGPGAVLLSQIFDPFPLVSARGRAWACDSLFCVQELLDAGAKAQRELEEQRPQLAQRRAAWLARAGVKTTTS